MLKFINMKFLNNLTGSLVRKSFYKDILEGKMKMGFLYVFVLQILISLFIVCIVSINISGVLPTIEKTASELLPPNAEIIIKEGKLRANINPIVIPMPPDAPAKDQGYKNFLVIDTTTSLTVEDLKRKETAILVNSEGIIGRKSPSEIQINTFKGMPELNLTINREWLLGKAAWIKSHAKYVPFILFLPVLVILYLLSLFWALIYGLIAYIILRLYKLNVSFKRSYSVGLYSRTFGMALSLLLFVVPPVDIWILSFLLNILFIFLMIFPAKETVPVAEK